MPANQDQDPMLPLIEGMAHECPAFHNSCPYKMVYTEEPNVKDHIQRCPAFSDGCPFQNKSAKECEELVQSIPKDHPKCPVFDQDAKFCPDGTNLMHMLDSQRHDLFTHKKH